MRRAQHLDKIIFSFNKHTMVIQHKQTGKRGMFFIPGEEDDFLAELIYKEQDEGTMIIEHTEVDDKLRGQNIGYELVHAAVEYAKSHGMKIVPLCPFAKVVMDKMPEWREVLRERL